MYTIFFATDILKTLASLILYNGFLKQRNPHGSMAVSANVKICSRLPAKVTLLIKKKTVANGAKAMTGLPFD